MTGLSKRARKTMTAVVAVGALSGGVMLVPQLAVAVLSTARATTTLNVRLSPSTSAQVLGVLAAGEQVERRGDPRGEWTPVRYRGYLRARTQSGLVVIGSAEISGSWPT